MPNIFDYIEKNPLKLKRDRIVNGIIDAISDNSLSKGDPIPSVNKFMQRLGVARMTIVNALNVLKERGIIISEDKVGYFVRDVDIKRELKVCLFLTGFNSYQEILYNNIIEGLEEQNITVDLYFHHCNAKIFKSLLLENFGQYGLYVITGFEDPVVEKLMAKIPKGKLLQIIRPPLLEDASFISQNFSGVLVDSLEKIKKPLVNYKEFVLIFPSKKGHPEEIKKAFVEFCNSNNINHRIENKVTCDLIAANTAYWAIEDNDLLSLIKLGEEVGLQIGRNLGILSYNETPMKEIIRNGITVISVDFAKMGRAISDFIASPSPRKETYTPEVIFRNSL